MPAFWRHGVTTHREVLLVGALSMCLTGSCVRVTPSSPSGPIEETEPESTDRFPSTDGILLVGYAKRRPLVWATSKDPYCPHARCSVLEVELHEQGWFIPATELGQRVLDSRVEDAYRGWLPNLELMVVIDDGERDPIEGVLDLGDKDHHHLYDAWECEAAKTGRFELDVPLLLIYWKRLESRCEEGADYLRRRACKRFHAYANQSWRLPMEKSLLEAMLTAVDVCGPVSCPDLGQFVRSQMKNLGLREWAMTRLEHCQPEEDTVTCHPGWRLSAANGDILPELALYEAYENRCGALPDRAMVAQRIVWEVAAIGPSAADDWRFARSLLHLARLVAEHTPSRLRAAVHEVIDEQLAGVSIDACHDETDVFEATALVSTVERELGTNAPAFLRLEDELQRCSAPPPTRSRNSCATVDPSQPVLGSITRPIESQGG
jgi:hypothetical protein